ncbi:MAG TPA: contractile injection system tape measure protein, partial [Candidatus Sulfotelmatobacter sp.]|nr:contractile injection system tape measure protein [Candidatus Sulfotelmatobacter sp.]
MSSASHKILRLVFEIELLGRDRAAIVQDRISAFSCTRLYTVLTESLSPLASDQQHLVFPKVELDAGQISFHHLEEDLAGATARCLRDWVLRAMPVRDAIDHLERSQGFLPDRGKHLSSIS